LNKLAKVYSWNHKTQQNNWKCLKIQKRKTKNWINPPNSKNHKTRFLGGKFFLKLQIKENIEILINLSNSWNYKIGKNENFKNYLKKNRLKIEKNHQTFEFTKLEKNWRYSFLLQIQNRLTKIWKISPISWNHRKFKKFGKCWGMDLFFRCVIFPHGNKKNGNSNPTKYIFGKNPTKLQKIWRKKTLNFPYLDNRFWQDNNTHKKILFYPTTSLFYNYILLSPLVENLQPTYLRKLKSKNPSNYHAIA
jgi:hypothetical protein